MMGPWRVYQLTFSCGSRYFGITKRPTIDRLTKHRHNWKNQGLLTLMRKEKPKVEILHVNLTKPQALYLEQHEIQTSRAKKILNRSIIPLSRFPLRSRNYEIRRGEYRCSICGETKPDGEFYRDRSRSCGLDSRCRSCSKYRERFGMKSDEIREMLRLRNERTGNN